MRSEVPLWTLVSYSQTHAGYLFDKRTDNELTDSPVRYVKVSGYTIQYNEGRWIRLLTTLRSTHME